MIKVQLPNGEYSFMDSPLGLQKLITEHMGNDVGYEVQELIEAADYTTRKVQTDLESYESSLDEWNCAGNDILETVNRVTEHIEKSKRLDRDLILKEIKSITKSINNIM